MSTPLPAEDSQTPPPSSSDRNAELRETLQSIAQRRLEKLSKDVDIILKEYTQSTTKDTGFLVDQYIATKKSLEWSQRELQMSKDAEKMLHQKLTNLGAGLGQGDHETIQLLQEELQMTTYELVRAVEDVNKLHAQLEPMQLELESKTVANVQLWSIVQARQGEIEVLSSKIAALSAKNAVLQTNLDAAQMSSGIRGNRFRA
ncbi:hypothetical protein B0O80DRAFT_490842 [Mortierella sp. GBAus27b]|nr:hypothetical protein B0O80DRAFT_490842 [Mortierella sp. GBAus27b]